MSTSGEEGSDPPCGWSVFDGVKSFRPATAAASAPPPETLMGDIDAAITALEHSRSTALLCRFGISRPAELPSPSASRRTTTGHDAAGLADEAYRSACASLAAGRPESALRSLRVALASCPPDKASAISKLRSLVAFASSLAQQQQQHKPSPSC